MAAAAEAGDIVRYESAAMRRLVASVEQWCKLCCQFGIRNWQQSLEGCVRGHW